MFRYLERSAKHIMKFKGEQFVEFLRRVLDYPRKNMINPEDPNFSDLVNRSVARACGAKVYLPPETYYEFTTHLSSYQKGKPKWSRTLSGGPASRPRQEAKIKPTSLIMQQRRSKDKAWGP